MKNVLATTALGALIAALLATPAAAAPYSMPYVFRADNVVTTASWVQQKSACETVRTTVYAVTSDFKRERVNGYIEGVMYVDFLREDVCTGAIESISTAGNTFELSSRTVASAELTATGSAYRCAWDKNREEGGCAEVEIEMALVWDAVEAPTRGHGVLTTHDPGWNTVTQYNGASAAARAYGFIRYNGTNLTVGDSSSAEIVHSANSIISVYSKQP
ncbi:hypothetical protein ACFFGH_18260 [Lysobacter korlensis]|uniref:Uncharacterized protein n=1 Tax=Lysobacter korlensis TaxID=553636 RepID=A0ABV6RS29_9GAMM